jgi:hypothetical protein
MLCDASSAVAILVEHGHGAVMGIENKRKKTHNEINHDVFSPWQSSFYDCKPKVPTACVSVQAGNVM